MDLSNPINVSIKTEPGSREEGADEMPCTDTEIDLPEVKNEYLQYGENIPRTGKIILQRYFRKRTAASFLLPPLWYFKLYL